jgi:hypothetical protein
MNSIDVDGLSTITFDGRAHTITVYSAGGSRLVSFRAFNNVTIYNPNNSNGFSNGPMTNGVHPIIKEDQQGATRHLHQPSNSKYGANGIIYVENFTGVTGNTVTGAALHSGRKGPDSNTYGCIRTTDEAMVFVNFYAKLDPLTEIDVQNNEGNIDNWAKRAANAGADIDDDVLSAQGKHNNGFGIAPSEEFFNAQAEAFHDRQQEEREMQKKDQQ